ncbi:MAG: hypothetical protein K8U57_07255 [Planctomycetes bacterium]|nr:hypothetical protein [Planctomycetota bacterium]
MVHLDGVTGDVANDVSEGEPRRQASQSAGSNASLLRLRTDPRFEGLELGKPFHHAGYLEELTAFRDRLKAALSGTPAEGEPTAVELAEQIKTLRAAHGAEAAPSRVKKPNPEAPKPPLEKKINMPPIRKPRRDSSAKPALRRRWNTITLLPSSRSRNRTACRIW